jgi:uncharacterized membrane protein YqjE
MDEDLSNLIAGCVIFILIAISCFWVIYKYRTQGSYSEEELL